MRLHTNVCDATYVCQDNDGAGPELWHCDRCWTGVGGGDYLWLPECGFDECVDGAGTYYTVEVDGGCGCETDYYCEEDGCRSTACECGKYNKDKAMSADITLASHPWDHYLPDDNGKCCDWYRCWYGHGDIYCCDVDVHYN